MSLTAEEKGTDWRVVVVVVGEGEWGSARGRDQRVQSRTGEVKMRRSLELKEEKGAGQSSLTPEAKQR